MCNRNSLIPYLLLESSHWPSIFDLIGIPFPKAFERPHQILINVTSNICPTPKATRTKYKTTADRRIPFETNLKTQIPSFFATFLSKALRERKPWAAIQSTTAKVKNKDAMMRMGRRRMNAERRSSNRPV